MHQPEKGETISPLSDTGTTRVTLVKVPCCQLSYIPHDFKHCDLLVLKIIILWEAMCITLYSQSPNTTFKIKFWVFTHSLWRAISSEHKVIPSKLMKRGWKYPLKHQEGGDGTPLKYSKMGVLTYIHTEGHHKATSVKLLRNKSWYYHRSRMAETMVSLQIFE